MKGFNVFLQQPSRPKGSSQPASQHKKVGADEPDIGLSGSHEFVKFLGRGGTGDTHLYKDRANGEEVAIKLVKRPVPKVVQPNLLREIRVRTLQKGSLKTLFESRYAVTSWEEATTLYSTRDKLSDMQIAVEAELSGSA